LRNQASALSTCSCHKATDSSHVRRGENGGAGHVVDNFKDDVCEDDVCMLLFVASAQMQMQQNFENNNSWKKSSNQFKSSTL
jgi:hypothetical protein